MSTDGFQAVPVPNRFVLRVMTCLAEWEAAEQSQDADAPGEAAWPTDLLRKISEDDVKSLKILTQLLDRMAERPGDFRSLSELAPATGYPHGSVSAAIRKLPAYFTSRYGRDDFPFTRNENRYGLTSAQAQRWKAVRRNG